MTDSPELVTVSTDGKVLTINFNEALRSMGRVDLSSVSDFNLVSKRNYARPGVSDEVAKSLQMFLSRCPGMAIRYLSVQQGIMTGQWVRVVTEEEAAASATSRRRETEVLREGDQLTDDKAFIDSIIDQIFTDEVTKAISDHTEATYDLDLNGKTAEAKRINSELQFTDEHAKIILKASAGIKVAIPALTQYMWAYDQKKNDNLLYDAYARIFGIFSLEGYDSLTKIFKLTESNIYSTRYSNRVIWSYLRNLAIDTSITTRKVCKKIVVDIICKIRPEENLIKYLISVIRNQVKYQFQQDFPVSYKPVDMMKTDSEGLSEFDKIEASLIRLDEGRAVINRLAIKDEIRRAEKAIGIEISEEEMAYWQSTLEVNKLQTNILFLFFAKHVGSFQNLYNCNREEYVRMTVLAKKWMEREGYHCLPQLLVAVPEQLTEKRAINKKEFVGKLISSRSFVRIHERKYRFAEQNLGDSGILTKFIATLHGNVFYKTCEFGEPSGDDTEVLEFRVEDVASEFLLFVESV
jgi:hypothetical protein